MVHDQRNHNTSKNTDRKRKAQGNFSRISLYLYKRLRFMSTVEKILTKTNKAGNTCTWTIKEMLKIT